MSDVPVTALLAARAAVLARAGRRPRRRCSAGVVASLAILDPAEPGAARCCSSWRRAPRSARAAIAGRRVARDPRWHARSALLAAMPGVVALGCDPGRPLRIAARVRLRLVRRSVRAGERRAEPRAVSALADRDAHAADLALAARAALGSRCATAARARSAGSSTRFAVAVVLAYLPYVYFQPDEWFYTRFLLPAAAGDAGAGAALVLAERARGASPACAGRRRGRLCCAVVAWSLSIAARRRSACSSMREGEQKYPRVGDFVREQLPATAFVLARAAQRQHPLLLAAGRPCAGTCSIAASLDRAIASLRRAGYEPFVVARPGRERTVPRSASARGISQARRRADAAWRRSVNDLPSTVSDDAARPLEDEDRQVVGEARRLRVRFDGLEHVRAELRRRDRRDGGRRRLAARLLRTAARRGPPPR